MTGDRIPFFQAEAWPRGNDPYSQEHCCYCGKALKGNRRNLRLSRTDDGEWGLCGPGESQPDEGDYGRFTLPVGPDCLRLHPEWKFAIVGDT